MTSVHAGILIVLLVGVALSFPGLGWPWYLLAPLMLYGLIVLAWPLLRRTAPRFAVGRLTGWPLLSAAILAAATSAVLFAYDLAMQPEVTDLAATIPVEAFGNIIVAWVCFSVLNAITEELVFRGVLYEALLSEWGTMTAIVVSSALFGLGHMHGYPPGPLGAFLAAGFGLALGLLRWWTGGLALAIVCHVCADATIFGILVRARAFDTRLLS